LPRGVLVRNRQLQDIVWRRIKLVKKKSKGREKPSSKKIKPDNSGQIKRNGHYKHTEKLGRRTIEKRE